MPVSLADIRRFLIDYYNDEELSGLCFDHFHEVYRNTAADATMSRKALALVDYCQRRDQISSLLMLLERGRPEPFRRIFGRVTSANGRGVNINTAGIEELRNLPGIGPALAGAIVAARPYAAVDELARVPGIGPRRLMAVRDWCVV